MSKKGESSEYDYDEYDYDESEDEDAKFITPLVDAQVERVIAAIRNNEEKIYDETYSFFDRDGNPLDIKESDIPKEIYDEIMQKRKDNAEKRKKAGKKKLTYNEFLADTLSKGGSKVFEPSESESDHDHDQKPLAQKTKEKNALKAFLDVAFDDEDELELVRKEEEEDNEEDIVLKKKSKQSINPDVYVKFLRHFSGNSSQTPKSSDKSKSSSKPSDDDILEQYFSRQMWRVESGDEKMLEEDDDDEQDNEDGEISRDDKEEEEEDEDKDHQGHARIMQLSEAIAADEEKARRMKEEEQRVHFRHEEEDAGKVMTHARVKSDIRRDDAKEKRKAKRERKKQRKKEEQKEQLRIAQSNLDGKAYVEKQDKQKKKKKEEEAVKEELLQTLKGIGSVDFTHLTIPFRSPSFLKGIYMCVGWNSGPVNLTITFYKDDGTFEHRTYIFEKRPEMFEWHFLPVDLKYIVRCGIVAKKSWGGAMPGIYGLRFIRGKSESAKLITKVKEEEEEEEKSKILNLLSPFLSQEKKAKAGLMRELQEQRDEVARLKKELKKIKMQKNKTKGHNNEL
ncbi:hypothetical protein ADUPG1_014203 [Aduncisulcus paluster]|uniref:Uncharacterized protein n=1 Tax=Aduncisulcus paluster TaxID=2918883 RepID=A0ABQ5KB79_9EUKA|nr:hypothetical protein ADUPG1_014203 [Aduncisulcus paluster]